MKKLFPSLLAALIFFPMRAFTGEFPAVVTLFTLDAPDGWTAGKSDDPAVVLRLENGKAFIDFAKLEVTLTNRYLQMRVKEQIESLRSKGSSIPGDIRQISLHGAANAYYTSYLSGETDTYIAFFTYNEASFAISAAGVSEGDFRSIVYTIRKPGEKIDPLKLRPKKIRIIKKKLPDGQAPPDGAAGN